jgi:hypothetical protein
VKSTQGKPKPKGTGRNLKAAPKHGTKPGPKVPARAAPKKPAAKKSSPKKPSPATAIAAAPPPPAALPQASGERQRLALVSRARAAKGREIGGIPDIADPERRERCLDSFKLFCETYNPEAFYFGWSDAHLEAIDRIEEAVRLGALFALAMDRGKGKTTLCRHGVLWAELNGLRRYGFLIGANATKAAESLDAIKTLVRYAPLLAADFPEVWWPVHCLAGIANRASGQTCGGLSTLMEWSADTVVFPTVAPPANWPKHWPLRADGMAPTSGVVIATSGLTGDGIRGSLRTLTTGEMVRPDLVLLDDPQTPESARSVTQNQIREQLVSADVLGMAGPGKTISCVMPCTVIEPGDMVDRILDRTKHPLWRGQRTGILKSMPKDLAKWDPYFEAYSRCAQNEPPDFAESNAYYRAHRDELEDGAIASWEQRKLPTEVSAVQHAMHLYFRDPFAFWAEYMNDPKPLHAVASSVLDPEAIAAKATNLGRLVVPRSCTRLTAFVDVGAHVLWYAVVAWDERFGGSVIDYGPYPDQGRRYFAANDARPTLSDLDGMRGQPQEAVIYAGLAAVSERILGRAYVQEETGAEFKVERCPVDANWGPGTDLVYQFCRRDRHSGVMIPSHGKFIGASSRPMANYTPVDGVQYGPRGAVSWCVSTVGKRGRHVVFDTNRWKTFTAERLRTPPGAAGCLQLFRASPAEHEMFADHCTAEYPVAVKRQSGGATVDEWKDRPGRDNHLWDCLVGASVAASLAGLRWDPGAAAGAPPAAKKEKRRIDVEALYRAAHPGEKWE